LVVAEYAEIARADFHLSDSYTQLWRLAGVHSWFSKDVNRSVKKAAPSDALCQPTAAGKGIQEMTNFLTQIPPPKVYNCDIHIPTDN
jgi:hypothetical protein